jgi:hypothetical protein
MAKAPKFSTNFKNTILDSGMDSVFNSGQLVLMSGSKPADADAALTAADVIAVISLPADAFAAAGSGEKAKAGTWEVSDANGAKLQTTSPSTATWFRLRTTSDDNLQGTTYPRVDGTVGVTGTTNDLDLNTATIYLHDRIVIDTFKISIP